MKMSVALGERRSMMVSRYEVFVAFDAPGSVDGRVLSDTEKSAAEITIGFVYGGEVAKIKIGEVALLDEMPELKWNLNPTVEGQMRKLAKNMILGVDEGTGDKYDRAFKHKGLEGDRSSQHGDMGVDRTAIL